MLFSTSKLYGPPSDSGEKTSNIREHDWLQKSLNLIQDLRQTGLFAACNSRCPAGHFGCFPSTWCCPQSRARRCANFLSRWRRQWHLSEERRCACEAAFSLFEIAVRSDSEPNGQQEGFPHHSFHCPFSMYFLANLECGVRFCVQDTLRQACEGQSMFLTFYIEMNCFFRDTKHALDAFSNRKYASLQLTCIAILGVTERSERARQAHCRPVCSGKGSLHTLDAFSSACNNMGHSSW
jgi:hypothetical protein